jgi:hypothetical protein
MNEGDLAGRVIRVTPLLIGPAMDLDESSIRTGLRMVTTWRWESDGWPEETGDLSDALGALQAFLLHSMDAYTHAGMPDYPIRRLRLVAARDALEAKVDILSRLYSSRGRRVWGEEERWR